MNFRTDQVAIVTGAAGGIGHQVVTHLASLAVPVVAVDRVPIADVPADHVVAMTADVSVAADTQRVVSVTESEHGPIGYLVNAAGVMRLGEIVSITESGWSQAFSVNATGVFLMTQSVLAPMITRRRGAIVTVASNAAHIPRVGMGAYCASKAAAVMFTKCVGLEVSGYGIRCNIVSPGSTNTPMLRASWAGSDKHAQTVNGSLKQFRLGIPLGRIAEPADIAATIGYLLSESARHITMQDIVVDGGSTLGV